MTISDPKHTLEAYLAQFRADFPRRDQFRWAGRYVEGLLSELARKNIDAIARQLGSQPTAAEDSGQALQNFIHKSPWNEDLPWARHRKLLLRRLGHPEGVLVFREVAFAKQGQHSVGVQRQRHPTLGAKVNCQIAVAGFYVSPRGCGPLALQLYLPRGWLQNGERLAGAGVPERLRAPRSKAGLTLELVERLFDEGMPAGDIVVSANMGATGEWQEGLKRFGYRLREGDAEASLFSPADAEVSAVERLVEAWRLSARSQDVLCERLGLDHFEGRSWRGFHHHACLVMVAAGYLLAKE